MNILSNSILAGGHQTQKGYYSLCNTWYTNFFYVWLYIFNLSSTYLLPHIFVSLFFVISRHGPYIMAFIRHDTWHNGHTTTDFLPPYAVFWVTGFCFQCTNLSGANSHSAATFPCFISKREQQTRWKHELLYRTRVAKVVVQWHLRGPDLVCAPRYLVAIKAVAPHIVLQSQQINSETVTSNMPQAHKFSWYSVDETS